MLPVALIFSLLVRLRRTLYRRGWLSSERLSVPVVVVGNITVGGAGKTPLILHLAEALRQQGRHPGIISRGYGGSAAIPKVVTRASDTSEVGDEPLLLARRSGSPVVIGRDRVAAARALLAAHPECDVILADDGLQHYRLARDVEIAVFDQRGLMNGWLQPAGPLREPVSRLAAVDAVVLNGEVSSPVPELDLPTFQMRLSGDSFYRLDAPQSTCAAHDLAGKRLHACAGIGDPQRFFAHLSALGLRFEAHAFTDHHAYQSSDLLFDGDALLTTEKDAVKLAALSLALPIWVLPVTAELSPDLAAFVLETLDGCPPA